MAQRTSFDPWLAGSPARRPEVEPKRSAPKRPWSLRLGSPFGIALYVHATFVVLLAWVFLSYLARGEGVRGAVGGLGLILAVFATVVLHELSHALTARRFGIKTRDIILLPIGGISSLERMPERPSEELAVTVAGPLTNVVIAALLAGVIAATGGSFSAEQLSVVGGPILPKLMWINLSLAIFNLLPAFPMDGGRVLRAMLSFRMERAKATALAARLGQAMALFFGLLGLMFNPVLLLIAIFVWMGAQQESALVQLRSALHGVPISSAMITDFKMLSPEEPLSRAAELIVAGFQHDFPVVEEGRPVGTVGRRDVVKGIASGIPDPRVRDVMHRELVTADPSELLETAMDRLMERRNEAMLVVRDGQVVGLITPENLGELLMFHGAQRQRRTS